MCDEDNGTAVSILGRPDLVLESAVAVDRSDAGVVEDLDATVAIESREGDGTAAIATSHWNGSAWGARCRRCMKRMAAMARQPCKRQDTSHPVAIGLVGSNGSDMESFIAVE
ncbi:MAG: hypothetical protein NTAFB01_16310 [Nitrospira sp.]